MIKVLFKDTANLDIKDDGQKPPHLMPGVKKMKKIILFSIILTSCAVLPVPNFKSVVTSPFVEGNITDCQTGGGIQNVKIYFKDRENKFVLTDNDGYFRLEEQTDIVLLKVYTPCPVYEFPKSRGYPESVIISHDNYKNKIVNLKPYYDEYRKQRFEKETQYKNNSEKLKITLNDSCLEKK